MTRDSLRPDPIATVLSPSGLHRGWVRMAAGRPPHQSWKRQVWLFLSEDRLCWVADEEIEQHTGSATRSPAAMPTTLYPSASAALASDPTAAMAAVEQLVHTGWPLVNYIPLDRIPVRSTPRGYVPGSAISRVANTQVVQQGLGAAFAVTAGSHTLFFSAPTEAAADAWVEAIQDAWTHCTMNVLRCVQASKTSAEQAQTNEQLLAATNASLRLEQQHLFAELQQVEAQHASQLTRVRLENLELQQQMQRTPRYEVEVATGTARGAGTNSRVFVDLVGRSGHHSGERQLTNQPEASMQPQLFKRGSQECFMVCCADIGAVPVVLLRQDASGSRPHWQPDWLRVRKLQPKGPPGPWTEFPLGTWLSAEKGLRTLSLRLEAGQPPGNWITYKLVIRTAHTSGAGTQADVMVRLVFKSAVIEHDVHADPDDFARGGEAHVLIKCLEHGSIQELWVGHSNTGEAADWLVDFVTLHKCTLQGKALQPAQRFKADGWIRGGPVSPTNPVRLVPAQAALQEVPWTMRVHTGRQKGAGTDANVFFAVDMQTEGSGMFKVTEKALPTNPGYYEAGCVDELTVHLPKAQVKKLYIRHDNTGHGAAWFLDYISLRCQDAANRHNNITYFPCFSWLQDDGQVVCLKKELPPSMTDPLQELVTYTVDVCTSALPASGTAANVYVELVGSKGTTGKVLVESSVGLKAGSCTQVVFDHYGLGQMQSCMVFLDASRGDESWRVDKVDAMAQPFQGGPADVLTFWFCTLLRAWAGEDMASASAESSRHLAAAPRKYAVTVKTSGLKGAGTDDEVFLSLKGSDGSAADLPLAASASAFEPGGCDTFALTLPYLGQLHEAVLHLGPEGLRPGWHVAWLHVSAEELQGASAPGAAGCLEEYRFVHKAWVDQRDEHGQRTTGPLAPVPSFEPFAEVHVAVEAVTCADKGAGTDADVYVRVHTAPALGDAVMSDWARLPAVVESMERGLTDTFDVMLSGIAGRLQKLDIKIEACALEPNPSWSFEHIKVRFEQLSNGQAMEEEAYFNGPCTLTASSPEATLTASRESVWRNYRVTIWTALTKHGGTDGDVRLQIEGSTGTTAVLKVPTLDGDFVGDSKTVKTVRSPRIGSIQGLSLATDAAPSHPGWDILKVLVEEEGTANSGWFACRGRVPGGQLKALTKYLDDPSFDMVNASISVTTAATWQADTDSSVWIILNGLHGSSDKLELLTDKGTPFCKGATDHFSFQILDVGELQTLDIGHRNDGTSPSWCPEQVAVKLKKGQHSGSTTLFHHNRMIPDAPGGPCSARLSPSAATSGAKQRYRIRTCTGDRPGNCLDHPAQVVLFGDGAVPPEDLGAALSAPAAGGPGVSGPIALEVPDTGEQPFQRDAQNIFTVQGGPLRRVTHAVVGHACAEQSWHLEWLEVQLEGPASAAVRFYCCDWLSLSRGPGRLQACLSSTTDPRLACTVLVRTGDLRGAGTSADIKVELHGVERRSGWLALQDTAAGTPFKRGCCDDFKLTCLEVGRVQALSVICEAPEERERAWFLDWVAIQLAPDAAWIYFPFNCWIPSNRALTREAQASHPETQRADYRVIVHTAGGAGFVDSAVSATLRSRSGEQQELQLCPGGGAVPAAAASGGHEDVFLLTGVPVRSVDALALTLDAAVDACSWFLRWVRVVNCITGESRVFVAPRLFGPAAPDRGAQQALELEACSEKDKEAFGFLKVEVCSAARGGRPLAERVYLSLLNGTRPVLPEFLLGGAVESPGPLFEPGGTQVFVQRVVGLDGAATAATLRFRVEEGGPRWQPLSVTVTDVLHGECTVLWAADVDGSGDDTAAAAEGCVEVALTRAAPLQRPAGSPPPASPREAAPLCDYQMKLWMRPADAGWRGHLLFDLEGDREPVRTGHAARRATPAGLLPLSASVSQAPDVGELQAVHLAVLPSADGGSAQHGTLKAVTVEHGSTGAVFHCELHRELADLLAGADGQLHKLPLLRGPYTAANGEEGAAPSATVPTCVESPASMQAPNASGRVGSAASTADKGSGRAMAVSADSTIGKGVSLGQPGGGYAIKFRTKAVTLSGAQAHVSFQLLGSIRNLDVEVVSADHFAHACTTFLEYATLPFCGDVQGLRLRVSGRGCLVPPRLALLGVEVTCLASLTSYCFPPVVVDRRTSFTAVLQRPIVRHGAHTPRSQQTLHAPPGRT